MSYINIHKQQRNTTVPNDDTTPEQRNAFYTRIGKPNKPNNYQFSSINGLPNNTIPDNQITEFKKLAHKNKLTQNQITNLYNKYTNWTKNNITTISHTKKTQSNEWSKSIHKKHNKTFNQNLKITTNTKNNLKIDKLQNILNNTKTKNHPTIFNLFLKLKKIIKQNQLITNNNDSFKFDPNTALNKINHLKTNPKFIQLITKTHLPNHKKTMQQ